MISPCASPRPAPASSTASSCGTATLGSPLLQGALAHLECWVIEEVSAGTHVVYLGGVHRAEYFPGEPLAYFRGRFGQLELDRDVPADADILDPALSQHFHDALTFFTHG